MSYVADTHALLWHLFPGPRRVGPAAQAVLDGCEKGNVRVIVPAVVLAEMIAVVEKNRLANATIPQLLTLIGQMRAGTNYHFTALRPSIVLASHRLTAIPDIFDRLIVAEAVRLGFPILTRDQTITNSGVVTTIW